MSNPRYEPRNYLIASDRGEFGRYRAAQLPWVEAPEGPERARWVAARVQCDVVWRIQGKKLMNPKLMGEIAKAGGFSVVRLRKVLRGEAIMRLEDLAAIAAATDLELRLTLGAREAPKRLDTD